MTAVPLSLAHRPAGTSDDEEVVLVEDVELLGAYSRCNCAASDDNPY